MPTLPSRALKSKEQEGGQGLGEACGSGGGLPFWGAAGASYPRWGMSPPGSANGKRMEEGQEFASSSEDSSVPALPALQQCCYRSFLNLCIKKLKQVGAGCPCWGGPGSQAVPWAEDAGTIPSALAEGSSSPTSRLGCREDHRCPQGHLTCPW